MASQVHTLLENARKAQTRLIESLDGADYCLDWKPEPSDWSLREVVYHLLDTPAGGLPLVVKRIISGELQEYDLWAGLTNITPRRAAHDLDRVRKDVNYFFQDLELALVDAEDADLLNLKVLIHFKTREIDEERSIQRLLDRGFDVHWPEHLAQARELRKALGL